VIRLFLRASSATFLVTVLVPACLGCPARSRDRGETQDSPAVVRINGQEIPYSDFEAYLEANIGEERPAAEDAETRSRLFDQFIEERLLLQAAQAGEIRVGDDQVEAYLANLGSGDRGASGKPDDAALRNQIRQNLLIQEFKDRVLLRDVRVAPEEVETYYRDHPDEFREARVVILRQILLEEASEAKNLLAVLRGDPSRFQVLAESRSASPDRGQPRSYEEGELPESIRATVFSLGPGEISDIVEEGGKYRIFQAVDRREGKGLGLEDVRKKIEVVLLQRKFEETLSRALAEMRRSAKIKIHEKNLPFRYSGEHLP
jgi:parvulin-like peptidyl-prolyl isomerase